MIVTKTELPYPKREGKVRDIYDLGDRLLMVATDRISAFDCVFDRGIPHKGKALTAISNYWFDVMGKVVDNHIIEKDVQKFPEGLQLEELRGRAVIVEKAEVIPLECIVRGYLAGSAWRSYKRDGTVHGVKLPEGMRENERLDAPMFTPSTKSDEHDENITIEQAREISPYADEVMEKSLKIYEKAYEHAEKKGIIICDTKFEFGVIGGRVVLIDELLTPDSSRFWYKSDYETGAPKQLDKEYLRKYLLGLEWDHNPPAPPLPDDVVDEISRRYVEICDAITGDVGGL